MSEPCRKPVTVACPNCGAEVAWDSKNRYRPFCSERCKLMDLGQWAAERYRMAGEATNQEPAGTQSGKD